jgi:hypothetical protein
MSLRVYVLPTHGHWSKGRYGDRTLSFCSGSCIAFQPLLVVVWLRAKAPHERTAAEKNGVPKLRYVIRGNCSCNSCRGQPAPAEGSNAGILQASRLKGDTVNLRILCKITLVGTSAAQFGAPRHRVAHGLLGEALEVIGGSPEPTARSPPLSSQSAVRPRVRQESLSQ